jgi:hypothetical protein
MWTVDTPPSPTRDHRSTSSRKKLMDPPQGAMVLAVDELGRAEAR